MHAIRVAITVAALAAMAAPAVAQAPALYTRWSNMTMDQQACLQRARSVMAASGISIGRVSQFSVFGQSGDYAITARCAQSKAFVFFVAAGPSVDECQRLVDHIVERF